MVDREKVIKGLECCHVQRNEVPPLCEDCPYMNPMEGTCDSLDELLEDALTLLKAQEPRVMTLEEVITHYSLPPVFDDDLSAQEDYYEDIQPLYFEFPYQEEDRWIVHWRGHTQVARYLDKWKHTYNMKWRCWTSRPTDEQREATPWMT